MLTKKKVALFNFNDNPYIKSATSCNSQLSDVNT